MWTRILLISNVCIVEGDGHEISCDFLTTNLKGVWITTSISNGMSMVDVVQEYLNIEESKVAKHIIKEIKLPLSTTQYIISNVSNIGEIVK